MKTRILIADDHAIVRQGLRQIVAGNAELIVQDEAASGAEVLAKVAAQDYEVIVLDLNMPGGNGLDILKQLKLLKPKIPVLVLSFHPEEQYASRVLKAGAAGYLTKESAPEELLAAIQKVALGRKYVSPALAEQLAVDLGKDAEKPFHEKLSDREYQVLCLLAEGKTVGDIATELFLSVKTISTYRARLLEKMGMVNNAQLTYYAIKHDLVI